MRIIVDAFGGDNAPLEIIKGALMAVKEFNVDICLTGHSEKIKKIAAQNNLDLRRIDVVHADRVIPADAPATDIMKEYADSSMAMGLNMIANYKGDGFVSAGNSGALCVGSTLIVKRLKGLKRPGFAPILPSFDGGCFMILDAGANIDARPEMLRQFAILGSVYMKNVMNVENPRVALANVGTEPQKGRELQQATYKLLKETPINFIGNLEGRDIPTGACDVYVCDGFTGNLILKTYEGVAKSMSTVVGDIFKKNVRTKLGASFVYRDLMKFKADMNADKYGGAPILGIKKPVFKAHGSSNAEAIFNAIRLMVDYIKADVTTKLEDSFNELKEK